jgi:hypothetical protein
MEIARSFLRIVIDVERLIDIYNKLFYVNLACKFLMMIAFQVF